MDAKKDILWRIYMVYLLICVFAVFILFKIVKTNVFEGDHWQSVAKKFTYKYNDINAVRGNIFDVNGGLLATSLPYYEVAMDPNADPISKAEFYKKVDSLAACFANLYPDKTKNEFKRELIKARKSKDRYLILRRNVAYKELQEIKKFPLLRKGRYKGGFIYTQVNKRERPFKVLAARTIGYYSETAKPVGLEGSFNSNLAGVGGKRLVRKIAGGVEMPVNDDNEIEPQDGSDLISTIDVNIQDVAESALLTQLIKNKAHHGCVILMEVATGEIRAIANLTRHDSTTYIESFNWAIGSATEPGSTFKLASLMAAMEDGYIDLNDKVDLTGGVTTYYGLKIEDAHRPEKDRITVKEVFETSSNVGISKLITRYYANDPQKFIDRLTKMSLDAPLKLSIEGEAKPQLKSTKDKSWSGVSLPYMSFGYESLMSPLQILNFYNAVANNGKMMRPMFVRQLVQRGQVVKQYNPEVINPAICSQATIEKAKSMMEGVVQNGSARNLKTAIYKIAGKTGTAQIARGKRGYKGGGEKTSYQASFVGYFPADKPRYSCMVMVSAPSNDVYYGNVVAGPIFKEVADKVYATTLDMHEDMNVKYKNYIVSNPSVKGGLQQDIRNIYSLLHLNYRSTNQHAEWVKVNGKDTALVISDAKLKPEVKSGLVPNVTGMGLKEALYLLENEGLIVKPMGSGVVRKQSLSAGSRIVKGKQIVLELS